MNKTIKFDHQLAVLILSGEKTSTWRIFDDKNLAVADTIALIDKVDPKDPKTWHTFAKARITSIEQKPLADITQKDMEGHETFESKEEMLKTYQLYYGDQVSWESNVKIIHFELLA